MPVQKKMPLHAAPKPQPLGKLHVSEYGVEPAKPPQEQKIVNPEEHAADLGKRWAEAVVKLPEPLMWQVFRKLESQMDEIVLLGLGYKHTMNDLGQSYNHVELLGAADAVLEHQGLLERFLPLSIRDIDMKELAGDVNTLRFLRGLLNQRQGSAAKLGMLVSYVQRSVDDRIRTIASMVVPAMVKSRDLQEPFKPLQQLVSQPAEEAAATKKVIAKALKRADKKAADQDPDTDDDAIAEPSDTKGAKPGASATKGKNDDPAETVKNVLRSKQRP